MDTSQAADVVRIQSRTLVLLQPDGLDAIEEFGDDAGVVDFLLPLPSDAGVSPDAHQFLEAAFRFSNAPRELACWQPICG